MKRSEIVQAVATRTGEGRERVDGVLTAFTDLLVETVARGEAVQVPGVLSIDVVSRAERAGRNPRTGEPLVIPAAGTARLRAGKRLREAARTAPAVAH